MPAAPISLCLSLKSSSARLACVCLAFKSASMSALPASRKSCRIRRRVLSSSSGACHQRVYLETSRTRTPTDQHGSSVALLQAELEINVPHTGSHVPMTTRLQPSPSCTGFIPPFLCHKCYGHMLALVGAGRRAHGSMLSQDCLIIESAARWCSP